METHDSQGRLTEMERACRLKQGDEFSAAAGIKVREGGFPGCIVFVFRWRHVE